MENIPNFFLSTARNRPASKPSNTTHVMFIQHISHFEAANSRHTGSEYYVRIGKTTPRAILPALLQGLGFFVAFQAGSQGLGRPKTSQPLGRRFVGFVGQGGAIARQILERASGGGRSIWRRLFPRARKQPAMLRLLADGGVSRKQAVADGVLVRLNQYKVIRVFWDADLYCSEHCWAAIQGAVRTGCALDDLLEEICWRAKTTISEGNRNKAIIRFPVMIGGREVHVVLHSGPGDRAELAHTLMLSTEA